MNLHIKHTHKVVDSFMASTAGNIFNFRLASPLYQSHSQLCHNHKQQESHAVARKPCDAAAVLFSLKLVDNIHYKFKSSQALKARLQSSKHTGAKQNLMQNGHSRSLKVTCFSVKSIRD